MCSIVECNALSKIYDRHSALKNVYLKISRGRIVGLLGPNGSGKTTLLKIICGLLTPSSGDIAIAGKKPGIETKKIISYLPDRIVLCGWMKIKELIEYYSEFYSDFSCVKAYSLLSSLAIDREAKLKTLSKGTKEKIQLILAMSREAQLYCLDEPIGGVDPASRDYIINTILNNYNRNATLIISTHLISDVENILDDVIFINNGVVLKTATVEEIRSDAGMSVDQYFRRVYRCSAS